MKQHSSHVHRLDRRFDRASSPAEKGFTLVELLVVIAIISIIAGFLVPTLLRGRGEAYKAQCQNNLRQLAQSAMIYADSSGKRFFPYKANGASHESLNAMVRFYGDAKKLNPKLFICPTWRGDAEEPDVDGKYELTEESCSYTWTDKKLGPTDAGYYLSSDKYIKGPDELNGHDDGLNAVTTGSEVEWILRDKLEDIDNDGLPKGLVR